MRADDLVRRVALDRFGALIPGYYVSFGVQHQDGIIPSVVDEGSIDFRVRSPPRSLQCTRFNHGFAHIISRLAGQRGLTKDRLHFSDEPMPASLPYHSKDIVEAASEKAPDVARRAPQLSDVGARRRRP